MTLCVCSSKLKIESEESFFLLKDNCVSQHTTYDQHNHTDNVKSSMQISHYIISMLTNAISSQCTILYCYREVSPRAEFFFSEKSRRRRLSVSVRFYTCIMSTVVSASRAPWLGFRN